MLFRSPSSINQCVDALTNAIDKEPLVFAMWRGRQPIIGVIHDHKFRIRKRPSFYYYNSCAPIFYGTFREELTGTLIEGHFSIHPVAKGLAVVLFAALTYAIIGGIKGIGTVLTNLLNFVSGKGIEHSYSGLMILPFILFGGIILMSYLLAADERKYLQEFLEETLKAHPISTNDVNQ